MKSLKIPLDKSEGDSSRNSKKTKSIMITSKYSNKDYIKQKTKLSYISSKSDIKKSSSKTDTVEKKATPIVNEKSNDRRIICSTPDSECFESVISSKNNAPKDFKIKKEKSMNADDLVLINMIYEQVEE